MIANLLPTEATHSSLDLFEKQALLVTFDVGFCQKLGPVYSPDGPMLEFEVTGDRNNFIDLQKIFLEVKCKITQSSGADLKYDAGAAADITKTDAPYWHASHVFSHNKDAKNTYEESPSALSTAEMNRSKAFVRGSGECTFYG